MSWFDTFADLQPRAIIVTTGCALSIAAIACWAILSCPAAIASTASSLLPLLFMILLPKMRDGGSENDASRTMREVIAAAIPARTLLGLAVTFFIVRSIATLAPEFEQFNSSVTLISLLVPLSITAFFIGSALLVKKRIDPPSSTRSFYPASRASCSFLHLRQASPQRSCSMRIWQPR